MWINSDENGSAAALFTWLQDDEVSRESKIGIVRGDAAHEMSAGSFELITALVSNGIALVNLLVAVAAWRNTRQTPTSVHIEHEGTVVVIEGGSPEQVAELAARLEKPPGAAGTGEAHE
ncbi:hypothetical protein [Actinoplanes sp. NPDC048796]